MNIINHPIKSLANFMVDLEHSNYSTNKILASTLTLTVFPFFLSLELLFKEVPKFLSLQFTTNQNLKDESTKKIQKLADSIISSPLCYTHPLSLTMRFMSFEDQQKIISEDAHKYKWASDDVKNDPDIALKAIKTYGSLLLEAPDQLKNDPNFALTAIKLNHIALKYISEQLKNDLLFIQSVSKFYNLKLKHVL